LESKSCFDIAIVGGGMIGAALARALMARSPELSVAQVAPQLSHGRFDPSRAGQFAEGFDARVYAVSPANARFLEGIGAWPAEHATPVHAMRVHGDAREALIEFDAYRNGTGELAWIVEDRRLQAALAQGLESRPGLVAFTGAAVKGIDWDGDAARVDLADGRALRARLVVGADGAKSPVRAAAGIASTEHAYGQVAVVANFSCARGHGNVAWQWFQGGVHGGAVLALLPLPRDHVSMVWSVPEAEAQRLLALDAAALARAVGEVAHGATGELTTVTAPRAFPLQRLRAARLAGHRVALAGDSAHVIHPLAGQGANLGLQDARALADVLAAREPGRDPGDARLLRRYERSRAEAILAMEVTVHGLFRLFDARSAGVARLRNAGLNLADRLPVLKNLLMRHAMG
jgi:2-octaprenylphenol hydroxylase